MAPAVFSRQARPRGGGGECRDCGSLICEREWRLPRQNRWGRCRTRRRPKGTAARDMIVAAMPVPELIMETRANYVLIGSFTLAVIAAAVGFVLWFQSLHTTKQRSPLRVVFEGPAAGLRNGGSVNFNGDRKSTRLNSSHQI